MQTRFIIHASFFCSNLQICGNVPTSIIVFIQGKVKHKEAFM